MTISDLALAQVYRAAYDAALAARTEGRLRGFLATRHAELAAIDEGLLDACSGREPQAPESFIGRRR